MEDSHVNFKTIKYLFSYIKNFKKTFVIIGIMTFLSTIITVITPYFLAYIIDHFLLFSKKKIFLLATILLFCYVLHMCLSRISSLKMLRVSETILYTIRKDLFSALQKLPMSYFDKNQKGDIMSRFTSDIEQIGDTINESLIDIIGGVITLIGSLILMFSMNVSLSLALFATIPIFLIGVVKVAYKAGNYFESGQQEAGNLNGYFEEHISGMETIQAFHITNDVKKEFEEKNKHLKETQQKAVFWSNLVVPLNTIVSNIGNILVLIYGAYLVMESKLTIGMLLAFLSYADMFRSPIQELASTFASMQSALAGANRVFMVIQAEKNRKVENRSLSFPSDFQSIHFQNVSFGYEDKMILSNLSFSVKKGETLAIVGETGSGKTTLIQLLLQLYSINKGTILIDEVDVSKISYADLDHKIGVILQEPFLFEGTILENVLYGNSHASEIEAIVALKEAGADFVERLPNQYHYLVEENGTNLSFGERQLITIARIILKNPDILILDEATSNVDLFTEKKVYDSIQRLMKKKTSIVIAHRLQTIENADRILLLEKGNIKEEGSNQELISKKGAYYTLYMSQF
jgi:ATP-binding cassette subfamily B protein